MPYYDDDPQLSHKTGRIAILSVLIFALGVLFFAYKIEACKSTPANCKDEFFEFHEGRSGYSNEHSCSPGATVEMVNGPRPGILCHCAPIKPTVTPPSVPGPL